jgi:hypothetical protein
MGADLAAGGCQIRTHEENHCEAPQALRSQEERTQKSRILLSGLRNFCGEMDLMFSFASAIIPLHAILHAKQRPD